jgi:hypothetical protein
VLFTYLTVKIVDGLRSSYHYYSSVVDWLSLALSLRFCLLLMGVFSPDFSVAPRVLSGISLGSSGEGPGSFFGESSFFFFHGALLPFW